MWFCEKSNGDIGMRELETQISGIQPRLSHIYPVSICIIIIIMIYLNTLYIVK